MAKHKRTSKVDVTATPDAEEQRRWQAESVVRDAMKKTPEFKRAVRATMRDLKQAETTAKQIVRGKKTGG